MSKAKATQKAEPVPVIVPKVERVETKLRTLAIIPAREGSKGLKDKNVAPFNGKPLIAWTIAEAKRANEITRVIISTDSKRYQDILEHDYGKDLFPFLRPAELATDTALSSGYVIHALDALKEQGDEPYDLVVILEPTCPQHTAEHINEAIVKMRFNRAAMALQAMIPKRLEQSAGEYYEMSGAGFIRTPGQGSSFGDSQPLPRQATRVMYEPCPFIYIARPDWYRVHKTFVSPESLIYPVQWWQGVEIDDIFGKIMVEALLKARQDGRL